MPSTWVTIIPSSETHWPSAGSTLFQRRRRWPNVKPALGQCVLFVGVCLVWMTSRIWIDFYCVAWVEPNVLRKRLVFCTDTHQTKVKPTLIQRLVSDGKVITVTAVISAFKLQFVEITSNSPRVNKGRNHNTACCAEGRNDNTEYCAHDIP